MYPSLFLIHLVQKNAEYELKRIQSKLSKVQNDLEDLAKYYNEYEDIMKFWKKYFSNNIYDLSYENLVSNPEEEIKNLIKFC